MPATTVSVQRHGCTRFCAKADQGEALHENVTGWMVAGIVPDHTDGGLGVAHCYPREVVHWEAIIAGDGRSLQRDDVDCPGGHRAGAGCCRQGQTPSRNEVHHVLHGDAGTIGPGEGKCGRPVVLICDVDITGRPVYRRICPLVLAKIRIVGSYDEVRRSRRVRRATASIGADGGCCRATKRAVADIADREFDDADRFAGGGVEKELSVAHIQQAVRGVNRQEIFVQEATGG